MSADEQVQIRQVGQTLQMSRQFNAPRELVFNAFSECEHLAEWWAPEGWSVTECKMDFRPGGSWHYQLSSVDGSTKTWTLANYREISSPEALAYDERFVDADRAPIGGMPVQHIGMRFSEQNGVTHLDYRAAFDSEADMQKIVDMGLVKFFSSTLKRFDSHLATL